MTEVSKEAVDALVKALSNVDETIELDLIDATAVAFELKKQGFTITRAEPVGFEAAIKQLGEPDDMNHWSLDEGNLRWFVGQCKAWSAMSDTELELRATMLVVGIRTGKYNVSEIVELTKKYRGK